MIKPILALDLGTDTGWATNYGSARVAGTWNLATPMEIKEWGKNRYRRRRDPRIMRFFNTLRNLDHTHHFDLVIFEDVQFSSSTAQTQLWSSLRGALWTAFPENTIIECVPTGTLKAFATGHGGATKEMMKNSFLKLSQKWGSDTVLSDDAIDAIWLWNWAYTHFDWVK
jgi:Holliday junction resolvasome RuvABC endonuclease subunit